MCGFDALTYAVWRSPVLPDWASIRTTVATATMIPRMRAARLAPVMNVSPLLLWWRHGRRLIEPCGFDVDVRADLRHFERIASVESGLGVLVRHLHAVH